MPIFNSIMVDSYDALFSCTAVVPVFDSMTDSIALSRVLEFTAMSPLHCFILKFKLILIFL